MTINDSDTHMLINSLNLQLKLIRDRIEQLQMVEKSDTGYDFCDPRRITASTGAGCWN